MTRAISMVTLAVMIVLLAATGVDAKRKALKLIMNKESVDLVARTITFKLNNAAEMTELKIFNPDGDLVEEKIEMHDGAPAGTEIDAIRCSDPGGSSNSRCTMWTSSG